MTRFLWRSGTASCPLTPDTRPRKRASSWTSLTRIGRCFGDGGPDDALADLQPERPNDLVRITFRVRDVKRLLLVVEEVDGEDGKVRQARDQPRNAPQQLVEIEHGRDFAPELEEGGDELLMLTVVADRSRRAEMISGPTGTGLFGRLVRDRPIIALWMGSTPTAAPRSSREIRALTLNASRSRRGGACRRWKRPES